MEVLNECCRTTRYLLLTSLTNYNTLNLNFLEKKDYELNDIAHVVNKIAGIFRADFNKILKAGDGIYENSDIEYVEFLLSRCKLLCRNSMSSSSAKVQENISYANALKGDHKMAPPPEQTSSKSNETPLRQAASEAENEAFGFMDAILELKKFFTDYPSLLELGKKLKQAQGDERLDVFYRHLISI
ncbi:hypothetical protein TNIN_280841 [Trichonephila inaurata madagascariensis]|uniref:Uncharacterized protein n=1 Tax=Trichonephila inaurata madagascariensis TaxID=2747483 RepID=A0A8X6IKG5_9ARAC|nr:hypothetical protein TNIN_280841 [Trichonephila inaurata madagascariensis]